MNEIHLDQYNQTADSNSRPYLSITWHKLNGNIYCHTACLVVDDQSVLEPAKITLNYHSIQDPNSRAKQKHFDNSVTVYLDYHRLGDTIEIPLNATELIDGIEMNDWTLKNDGSRNHMRRYPTGIEWSIGDYGQSLLFETALNLTPALIMEKYAPTLTEGDKLTINIHFT